MSLVIKNARIVNEGKIIEGDLAIKDGLIDQVGGQIEVKEANELDANGKYLLPGVIDDQVHFRQPGLTHKADIRTESKAAAAGGVTSFMERCPIQNQPVQPKKYCKRNMMSQMKRPTPTILFIWVQPMTIWKKS